MNVVIYGATGMVGQGVLRECLLDPRVKKVLSVGRSSCGKQDSKLGELLVPDLGDYSKVTDALKGYDVCFFCLGVSSAGMTEEAYTRVTHDFTIAAAKALLAQNPGMTFTYVSGAGTDSTEKGRSMWARVKGRTENALLAMPFKAAFMFRPGAIQPLHGIKSRTVGYRLFYSVGAPLVWLMKAMGAATTTENVGRAMINVADKGFEKRLLEGRDIDKAAALG